MPDHSRVADASCIDVAADFLAAQPGAAARLLATHRARSDGRCAGCLGASARWPCTTAVIATRAADRDPRPST